MRYNDSNKPVKIDAADIPRIFENIRQASKTGVVLWNTGRIRIKSSNHLEALREVLTKARKDLDLMFPGWEIAEIDTVHINEPWWEGESGHYHNLDVIKFHDEIDVGAEIR